MRSSEETNPIVDLPDARDWTAARIQEAREDAQVAADILEVVDYDMTRLVAERTKEQVTLVNHTLVMAVIVYQHFNFRWAHGCHRWVFRRHADNAVVEDLRARAASRSLNRPLGEVRCRFCDELLVAAGLEGENWSASTDPHTIRCAVGYLAHLRAYCGDPQQGTQP